MVLATTTVEFDSWQTLVTIYSSVCPAGTRDFSLPSWYAYCVDCGLPTGADGAVRVVTEGGLSSGRARQSPLPVRVKT